jgi:steroid delta-isomerase-like uncharacterized protein
MSDQNKSLARRAIDEVFNQGKLDVIPELTAANAIFHDPGVPGGKFVGPDGLKQFVQIYRTAFPDIHLTINDQIAEGDKVVTRWTGTGTHKGELMGIKPTGKHSTVTGVTLERFEAGKVAESWFNYDMLGMLQQLGVVPTMTPAGVKS